MSLVERLRDLDYMMTSAVCPELRIEAADRIAALEAVLKEARPIIERAGAAKLADGTYFDSDCACTLWLARIDALLTSRSG